MGKFWPSGRRLVTNGLILAVPIMDRLCARNHRLSKVSGAPEQRLIMHPAATRAESRRLLDVIASGGEIVPTGLPRLLAMAAERIWRPRPRRGGGRSR